MFVTGSQQAGKCCENYAATHRLTWDLNSPLNEAGFLRLFAELLLNTAVHSAIPTVDIHINYFEWPRPIKV